MNWKNLFFISTAFWISMLILANCAKRPNQIIIPSDKETSFKPVKCPKGSKDPECQEIRDQIEAYEKLLSLTQVSLPVYEGPGLPPPPIHIDLPINGESISVPTLCSDSDTLRGYRFSIKDISWILDQAVQNNRKYIYTMFAVNPDAPSVRPKKSPVKYLDMYFQVKGKNEGDMITFKPKSNSVAQDGYADFPRPCPNYCPD